MSRRASISDARSIMEGAAHSRVDRTAHVIEMQGEFLGHPTRFECVTDGLEGRSLFSFDF